MTENTHTRARTAIHTTAPTTLEAAKPRPRLIARDIKSGKVVEPGQAVTDHRGEQRTFEQATRANGDDRDGKVMVDGTEYYARVFDLIVSEAAWC